VTVRVSRWRTVHTTCGQWTCTSVAPSCTDSALSSAMITQSVFSHCLLHSLSYLHRACHKTDPLYLSCSSSKGESLQQLIQQHASGSALVNYVNVHFHEQQPAKNCLVQCTMKKALGETQTLHAGCSKVEPKNFAPRSPPSRERRTAKS